MISDAVLTLDAVSKSFGPTDVLHDIGLTLRHGQVHGLIGENGAGKSTTMKILAGCQPATSGRILLDGQETRFASLYDGEAAGIAMIHKEGSVAPPPP